jgi:hypothetical protein
LENAEIPHSAKLGSDPIVAEIENLGPVAPTAQMVGKAIFDISQQDTKHASATGQMYYGVVFEPWKEKIETYRTQMGKLAGAL